MGDRWAIKYSDSVLTEQVRALEKLDLDALRAEWASQWGRPPKLRAVVMLRSIIAWRLQAATSTLIRGAACKASPSRAAGFCRLARGCHGNTGAFAMRKSAPVAFLIRAGRIEAFQPSRGR
jgi:hypothetical protein